MFLSNDLANNPHESHPQLFFVLAHGLFGSKADFASLEARLLHQYPGSLVLVSEKNTSHTTEGVANGGKRLAKEIVQFLLTEYGLNFPSKSTNTNGEEPDYLGELEETRYLIRKHQHAESHIHTPEISPRKLQLFVIGHSLGGLYLRNALGHLYKAKFFDNLQGPLQPRGYISISSPHLGSRRPDRRTFWDNLLKAGITASAAQWTTVKDLCFQDSENQPILLEMSNRDSIYYKALELFNLTAISTTHYDFIVPFASSAIAVRNPYETPASNSNDFLVAGATGFDNEHLDALKKYSDIDSFIYKKTCSSDRLPSMEAEDEKEFLNDEDALVEFHKEVFQNLSTLHWRRINVQFNGSSPLNQLLTHQTPLAKKVNRSVTFLFRLSKPTKGGNQFLDMLLDILDLDTKSST